VNHVIFRGVHRRFEPLGGGEKLGIDGFEACRQRVVNHDVASPCRRHHGELHQHQVAGSDLSCDARRRADTALFQTLGAHAVQALFDEKTRVERLLRQLAAHVT
jgi:hypothetical protein